ncbi:MAG: radical SAM protein [Desulfobacter sp.]|nr:MAG: radical SAM protein [Desulfobacter sp.]
MKILLVNPACLDQRITDDDAKIVPIGLYYLAAQALEQKMTANILNLADLGDAPPDPGQQGKANPLSVFKKYIKTEPPDIIGFSVTNPSRINAMACATAARKLLPQTILVFGGPAPTFMGEHFFKACPALDIIVQGEGETSFTAMITAVKAGRIHPDKKRLPQSFDQIPGLVIRRKTGRVDTGPAQLLKDLDTLVHPSKYFVFQHLSMSRGCPGKCTFCGSPKFWGSADIRRHSAGWFFEEIKTLARKGVSHFYISDDTFTMDREAVIELCENIITAGLSITWNAISRVDYIDAYLLKSMRKAGCIQISFGVESGSAKIRKTLGKPIDNDICVRAFDLVKAHGILPRAYFIYGSPGENQATIDQSIELMERLGPLSTVFYMLVIFPGTHLYTRAVEKGWVNDDIWYQQIEDLPWFKVDKDLDFTCVKSYGDRLRSAFFTKVEQFAAQIDFKQDKELFPFHADFLSRLALTFSHGEYSNDPRIKDPDKTALALFEKAFEYHPDPRAYLGLAMIHQKAKLFSKAVHCLENGLAHFPGHKDLCVCMGVCLMNQAQFSKALSFFIPFDKDPCLGHYIDICKNRINSKENTP